MKIVQFSSGLGNQIFYYLFSRFLEDTFPTQKTYGYYPKKQLSKHNGLEIDKVFSISLPKATALSNIIALLCRLLNKIGVKGFRESSDPCNLKSILFTAYYQDKKYFGNHLDEIQFKKIELDPINRGFLSDINNSNSVSLHIRRGDYLSPKSQRLYGNIATADYYRRALNIIRERIGSEIKLFVFSNDPKWCEEYFKGQNAIVVNHNYGDKSFIDLYLMSQCKHNIIANSSFSYWGAMLNKNPNKLIIYPSKWNNLQTPDMFPDTWLGI